MGLILGAIGAIATAALSVSKALAVVGLAVQGLKTIGNAMSSIAKALGIIKPERDIEEIGDRALQAQEKGMTPDKYDSYEAWVRDIDADNWGYDPEKNKDMSQEQKVLKGVEVAAGVAIERFPELPVQKFLCLAGENSEFFTKERMDELGKLAGDNADTFEKIINFVTGEANDHVTVDVATDALMNIEKTIDPGISEDMAYDKVAAYKNMK